MPLSSAAPAAACLARNLHDVVIVGGVMVGLYLLTGVRALLGGARVHRHRDCLPGCAIGQGGPNVCRLAEAARPAGVRSGVPGAS